MAALEARNHISSNADVGTLLQKLFNIKYVGTIGIRDYVLRMIDLMTKFKLLMFSFLMLALCIKP